MAGFVALIGAIGCAFAYFFNDWAIAIWVLVISAIYAAVQYFIADKLAVAMTGAKKITKKAKMLKCSNKECTFTKETEE